MSVGRECCPLWFADNSMRHFTPFLSTVEELEQEVFKKLDVGIDFAPFNWNLNFKFTLGRFYQKKQTPSLMTLIWQQKQRLELEFGFDFEIFSTKSLSLGLNAKSLSLTLRV